METTVIEPGTSLETGAALVESMPAQEDDSHMALASFIDQVGEGLLEQVRIQNPPV